MAKARAIPGLRADETFAVAAARVITVRAGELTEHSAGVLDVGEIERVHDLRVATRRLRAALELFRPCFAKREFKVALKEVKTLADALGERRDRDVTIAELGRLAEGMDPDEQLGVLSLVDHLRGEQSEANLALAPFVSEPALAELAELLGDLVRGLDPAEATGL